MKLSKKHDIYCKTFSFCTVLVLHLLLILDLNDQENQEVFVNRTKLEQNLSKKIHLRFSKPNTKTQRTRKEKTRKLGQTKKFNFSKIKQKIEQIDLWSPRSNFRASSLNNTLNPKLEGIDSSFQFIIPGKFKPKDKSKLESELIAFSKRVYQRFVSQMVETIGDEKRINPATRIPASRARDHVMVQVTYDHNGNLIRMQTLDPAKNSIYNKLFEKALGSIESIPNPPTILLDRRKQYRVNYALKVNYL